ncbi:DNA excision repair protein ERCC-5 homolog [Uloborus diversus]|uniref:DNA excision repair protein ERCC-5 homolog n=1 Tax=Uloborus diversus TaxID=327109 RepID=UPI00240929BA|nr:DNA excision repair protein ERCC-5 homolog [Uloborus diversus]
MGVLGLWQLLAPVGQPVTLESLENKIFAVDISIWLNQALKGYRDSQGGSVPNAHLLSLFSRLCKLLFYKIKPIIVFDGGFPELKRQTIYNRHQRRATVKQNTRNLGLKILANYVEMQSMNKGKSDKVVLNTKEKARDEIFKLPPLPENNFDGEYESSSFGEAEEVKFGNFSREDIKYLNQIDLDSDDFNCLPPDVKQEILSTLKESRKHRTWDQYEELPEESNEFSKHQMKCLLKRRNIQSKLERVQKEIREINSAEFVSNYTSDHVIGETNKIMSDDCSYYVLLKKMIRKNETSSKKNVTDEASSASVMLDTKNLFIKDMENIDVDAVENEVDVKVSDVKIKEENFSSISYEDDEDVDNPPLQEAIITSLKEVKKADESDSLSSESEMLPPDSSIEQKEIVFKLGENLHKNKSAISSAFDLKPCLVSAEVNEVDLEGKESSVNQVCDDEVQILPETNESGFQTKKLLDETVSIESSSEEELIPCDEIDGDEIVIPKQNTKCEKITQPEDINSDFKNVADDVFDSSSVTQLSAIKNTPDFDIVEKCTATSSGNETLSENVHEESRQVSTSDTKQLTAEESFDNLELQEHLESATALLEAEKAKLDRQSNTVEAHMVEECKELLKLFGIPYVVSPLEAEAQCAFFDSIDLTNGTITDDSDVWLFGGKRVYKNFFTQQKFVEFYKDKEVFSHFGLTREKLINFALLTGSDYTLGIEGVGPVTAMEIISEFSGEGIDALHKFKEWWNEAKVHANPPKNKIRAKLLKLDLPANFPEDNVVDAYLNPEVDSSAEKFSWGRPDLDALRDYARERFGWNKSKVDDALLPVIKKLNERTTQSHLDSFFTMNLKKTD